jgi:hypothetical protein
MIFGKRLKKKSVTLGKYFFLYCVYLPGTLSKLFDKKEQWMIKTKIKKSQMKYS